jgi:alpha-L-arabinofuranosidase
MKAQLRSNSGRVWAHDEIEVRTGGDYTQHEATIQNSATAPNAENGFDLVFDTANLSGHTFYFGLVSLFGETFKGRRNGLRKDIAEAFYDMRPKFLRFPGGNNLEGISHDTRWKWFETIGPLRDRPGRPGNWKYYNTDGLGLLEYLEVCLKLWTSCLFELA